MSHLTEKAIRETLIDLLSEKPFDKITVRELTESCGINRNTFYYHYHDMYDLLDSLFKAEEANLLSNIEDISTLRDGLTEATRFVLKNERAVYHIYASVNRDRLTQYLYESAEICMRRIVMAQAEGLEVDPSDLEDVVYLYSSMIEGAIVNIMRDGAIRDAESLVDNACRLLEGSVHLCLENATKGMSA